MADDQQVEEVEMVEKQEKSQKGAKLSSKLEKVVEELEKLTVLELSEVVNVLQDRWGVTPFSMAAPAMGQTTPEAGDTEAGAAPASGGVQTVVLTNAGANKIAVIKALREINPNLGLKEAKDLTEKLPAEVVKDVKAEEAKNATEKLQAAGATVEVK